MPFIGAPSPKDLEIYETLETVSDRKTYTGDGVKRVFGVSYFDNHITVFVNGLKLAEGIDYNIASSGQYITFIIPPESGDLIDLIGAVGVTNLSQSSYLRETFVASAGQNNVVLTTSTVDASVRMNVYVNGIRLTETDYTINYTTKTITFINNLAVDDTIAVDLFQPGFRIQSLQLTDLGISDGANNQVLTTYGNGVFYFANTTGGVSLASFTANGTITAGKTVALRNDGSITDFIGQNTGEILNQISIVDSSTNIGNSTNFGHQIGYDTNSDKLLFTYFEGVAGEVRYANTRVGEIINNELVLSNPYAYETETPTEPVLNHDYLLGTSQSRLENIPFIPSLNKFLITYTHRTILKYVLAEIQNDNSVTYSTPIVAHDNTAVGAILYYTTYFDISTNKIITIFSDISQAYSLVSDIDSNSTITLGTASNNVFTGFVGWHSIDKEPSLNKYVVTYVDAYGNFADIKVGTISGNTMSFGTNTTIPQYAKSNINTVASKAIVKYVDSLNTMAIVYSAGPIFKLVFAQAYANNNVTLSSTIDIDEPSVNTYAMDQLDAEYSSYLNKMVLTYRRGDTTIGNDGSYAIIDFANTIPDIVYSDTKFLSSGTWVTPRITIIPNSTTIVHTYMPGAGSVGSGRIVISEFDIEDGESPTNYIGIAKDAVSSGQVCEVFLVGDVADNQTGLTTNQNYYLNENGTLSTTETQYGLVGRALSSNSILLSDNLTPTSLTNLNIIDGTSGQVLKTYGNNTFYFADEENLNAILYSIALG